MRLVMMFFSLLDIEVGHCPPSDPEDPPEISALIIKDKRLSC